ncbi:MAG: exodeoxyribonuclease VII small subunit [Caulobacteraceae bacterium]
MPETQEPAPADIAALSFEQALKELEDIVARLESGQTELEKSIELYERGAKLKAHCEARLEAARLRVEKIVTSPQGAADRLEPASFE